MDHELSLISELIYRDNNSNGNYRRKFEELIAKSGAGDFSQKLYDADRMIFATTTRQERDNDWIERDDVLDLKRLRVIPDEMLSFSELLLVTGLATVETRMTTMDQRPDYTSDVWKFVHRFATYPNHAKAEYGFKAQERLMVIGLSKEQTLQLINPELNKIIGQYFG